MPPSRYPSNTISRARTRACRNRIGPPSSRTTRNPAASLPIERPRVSVSTVTGTPSSRSTTREIDSAAPAAASSAVTANASSVVSVKKANHITTRSSSRAIARVANDAGRSSRTTASPITRSSVSPSSASACTGNRGGGDWTMRLSLAARPRTLTGVDLDAFVAVHSADWNRLDRLSRRRRLSGEEADELVRLYQRAATHLSVVRSASPDPELAGRLSRTVATARAAVAGSHEPFARELARFVVVSFPAAVYRARWATAMAAAFTLLISFGSALWVVADPRVEPALATEVDVEQLVNTDFEHYYSTYAASSFAL